MNLTCRVCSREERNCVPVFGEDGIKQDIPNKARVCLSLAIHEKDYLPKQICQMCLAKLDDTWEFYLLCQKTQALLEKKFELGLLSSNYKENVEAPCHKHEATLCPVCKLVVEDYQRGVGCDGICQRWYHCSCINMTELEYNDLSNDTSAVWVCKCCQPPKQNFPFKTVEDKLKLLSKTNQISLGKLQISIVEEPEPIKEAPPAVLAPVIPASPDSMVGMLPAQTIMASPPIYQPTTTASTLNQPPAPAASNSDVYPESLIHVNPTSKQIVYHQRNENSHGETQQKRVVSAPKRSVPVPKPMPPPTNNSSSARRALARESQSNSSSPAKRHLRLCKFCNKQFPNDIIEHHQNLHLRKSFSTCLDCNKNFRTQLALDRHKCEPIDLDADDELICL